jgi:quinol monooxygenase YgiN
MIVYINTYKVKPGTLEKAISELNATGAEEMFRKMFGNVVFNFSVAANDTDTFYLTDVWKDQASFDAHLTCGAMPLWHSVRDKYVIDKVNLRYDTE